MDQSSEPDQIWSEPFGTAHKRMENCFFPAHFDLAAIKSLKSTWKAKNATYFVVPQSFGPPLSQGLELCIALVERSAPEQVRACVQPEFWDHFLDAFAHSANRRQCAFVKGIPVPSHSEAIRAHMNRVIEYISQNTATSKGAAAREQLHTGIKCFVTRLPPSLMPAVDTGNYDKRRLDAWADGVRDEESELWENRQEPIAVFSSDPRYIIMSEFDRFRKAVAALKSAGSVPAGRLMVSCDFDSFLELALQTENAVSGLKSMIEWTKLEVELPSRVRLFFVEDFLQDPETALESLCDFLGLQNDSNSLLLETVTQEMQRCLRSSRPLFGYGHVGVPELQVMQNLAQEFEAQLALSSSAANMAWAEQVSEFLQVYSMGRSSQIRMLLPSLPWWWEEHQAGTCKPCNFASRGICRNSIDCNFCHGVHQKKMSPSKKTRKRRERQKQKLEQCRSPSPSVSGFLSQA